MTYQAYLVSPANLVCYAFDDHLYNAGTLKKINLEATSYLSIQGLAGPQFGVQPIVFGRQDGVYELLYAPKGTHCLLRDDGAPAIPTSPIVSQAILNIPQPNRLAGEELKPFQLESPNEESIKRYIYLSRVIGEPEETDHKLMEELERRLAEFHSVTQDELDRRLVGLQSFPKGITQEELERRLIELQNRQPIGVTRDELEQRLAIIQEEFQRTNAQIVEVRGILEALIRRMYQIAPITIPTAFTTGPVLSVPEIQAKMAAGQITGQEIIPIYQPYGGSTKSKNRIVTFYCQNGEVCHAKAEYDQETNKIKPPS